MEMEYNNLIDLREMVERYVSVHNKRSALPPLSVEYPVYSAELSSMQKEFARAMLKMYGYQKKDGIYTKVIPVKMVQENDNIHNTNYNEYEEILKLPRCGDEYGGKIIDTVERFYPVGRECPFPGALYACFRLTLDYPDSEDYRYVYFKRISKSEDDIMKDMLARAGVYPLEEESDWEFITRYRRQINEILGRDGYWYYTYISDGSSIIVRELDGRYLSPEEILTYMGASVAERYEEEKKNGRRMGKFQKVDSVPRRGEEFYGRVVKEFSILPIPKEEGCPFKDWKHVLFRVVFEHEEGLNDISFVYITKQNDMDYRNMLIKKAGVIPMLQEDKEYFLRRVLGHIRYVKSNVDRYGYYLYFDFEGNTAACHEWTGEFLSLEQIHKYLGEHLKVE